MTSHRSFHNGNHQQRGYNSHRHPNYQPSRQYDLDDYVNPNAYDASFAQYEYIARQFRNGNHQQRGYNSRRHPNYQPSRQYNLDDYVNPNAYDASFAQYEYTDRQFRNGNHQQQGYNSRRCPNYQPSRQYNLDDFVNPNTYDASFAQYEYIDRPFRNGYHQQRQQGGYNSRRHPNYQTSRHYNLDDYVNPNAYDASFAQSEYIARQFRNGNHQQRGYNSSRHPNYQPSRQYNLDDYINPHAYDTSFENAYRFQPVNFWNRLLNFREINSRFRSRPRNNHDEQQDVYGHVLKYLKIRTHHVPEVVAPDVESDTCVICQSEYEHEENIGALQCGHEFHTDCIKKWLTKKKDCPMCRASVLPSKEQRQ
ncbi:hypothetical protein KY290_005891 [Solanum tuberosum]|uniref:RING-type E3 ubiquitin transferase n=1 Tax=Solanum tuberosum TaxID=4113 RepID=A0ABQ7WFG1_SOLTU|nr:hypothetical protein KY284_005901 [Solanum tuberosum]KAH0723163.1 hypothetical protein KY289_006207 [Solanum tuberosum]KAH0752602.1 hypothetical protein KY285_005750 [Solanum tuberosum]KAH0779464.1 hypothetical protein KY290_005891 [Solanum tuberosum]